MKIKNSNKVLILILVLTAAVPFLVAQVFMHKIKNNQFVYEKHKQEPYPRHPELNMKGSLEGVKVVKLIGDSYAELLGATILHNDLNNYLITRDRPQDSVIVHHSGDTLVFKYYDDKSPNSYRTHNAVSLRLNFPENIPVIASSSHVTYALSGETNAIKTKDSLAVKPYSPLSFYLSNGAILSLGFEPLVFNRTTDTSLLEGTGVKGGQVFIRDTTAAAKDSLAKEFTRAGDIQIYAIGSTVRIEQSTFFDGFGLDLDKNSVLELKYPIKVKKGAAKIDPEAKIDGNYRGVKSIQELTKQ